MEKQLPRRKTDMTYCIIHSNTNIETIAESVGI